MTLYYIANDGGNFRALNIMTHLFSGEILIIENVLAVNNHIDIAFRFTSSVRQLDT
jgi:hypothetical protein